METNTNPNTTDCIGCYGGHHQEGCPVFEAHDSLAAHIDALVEQFDLWAGNGRPEHLANIHHHLTAGKLAVENLERAS
ncbi:MAG: hypothetical protein F4Z02_11040 [Acidimicrobiia bacterium]|nr:hypothetical protein [Acidimicrobiia bacterium]MYG72674.1 hypothetical protein [Acidimicrobiia bacterium]